VPTDKRLLIFLIALSLTGCAVIWLATSTFGAGLSSDAVRIISTGQNFIEGRGLVISTGAPLIFCPPYYSILLGLLSTVFQSDVFTIGMYLNILVFGNIIFWSGILFSQLRPSRPIYIVTGSLVVATSPSLIRICANVAPDPLFILFVIWFLIAAGSYLRAPTFRSGVLLLIISMLAANQRYLGLTVVLSGAVLVFWLGRGQFWQALRMSALFSLIAAAPTLGYIFFHNYLGFGTLTGPRYSPNPLENIRITLEKVTHWFIPGTIMLRSGIWIWIGLGMIVLMTGLYFAWKNGRLKTLPGSAHLLSALVFLLIYGLTLIFMLSFKEHRPLLVDRIQIVLLVPLLVVIMECLSALLLPLRGWHARLLHILLLTGFALWLIYPVNSSYRYIVDSLQEGDVSPYNLHNTRAIRESDLAGYLESHPLAEEAVLFSNYNETAWFLTRRQVEGIPTADKAKSWPTLGEQTYLIWFGLPELSYMPKTMLTLEQIATQVNLESVFSSPDGMVYRMTAK
jgi:hypothetical protein